MAFTSTSFVALTLDPASMKAWTLESAVPISTPPATPTKPPAAPPATVRDLKKSTAETLTDWDPPAPPFPLTKAKRLMNAFTRTVIRVTPTPPATPTKPPPTLAASPKISSLEVLSTATPWMRLVPKPSSPPAS